MANSTAHHVPATRYGATDLAAMPGLEGEQ